MARSHRNPAPDDTLHHFYAQDFVESVPKRTPLCAHPLCQEQGQYRAPINRQSVDQTHAAHYFFCLAHVREYNAAWNYYAGMNAHDMERALRDDAVWNRPTWPMGQGMKFRKHMEERVRSAFADYMQDDAPSDSEVKTNKNNPLRAELMALRELGLQPPVAFSVVKKRYRALVKKHHPDLADDAHKKDADERLKKLNAAFTLLKVFYTESH